MCIAIYSLKGTALPTQDILKNCFKANPDGCGFAYADKGTVYTHKGFFNFDAFYKKLLECDRNYALKDKGVLIHFRIATHGSVDAANCHPFALSSKETKLRARHTQSKYAVIHNGICRCTSGESKKETLSDTALFVRDYLSKLAYYHNWFTNPQTPLLIHRLIDSKMAILNKHGDVIATEGFHQGEDGNYYSNYSYREPSFHLYDYGFWDDRCWDFSSAKRESAMPLMQLKKGEAICYDDGTVEEYRSDYHASFKTYVSKEYEVYTVFEENEFSRKIPIKKLSYIGNGAIVDNFFSASLDEIHPAPFRQDAVAIL